MGTARAFRFSLASFFCPFRPGNFQHDLVDSRDQIIGSEGTGSVLSAFTFSTALQTFIASPQATSEGFAWCADCKGSPAALCFGVPV